MQDRRPGLSSETPTSLAMIFFDRNKGGSDKHLEWKVRFFLLGAALAMAGVGLDSSILITLATLVLLAGIGLRFLAKGDGGEEGADDTNAEDPEAEA